MAGDTPSHTTQTTEVKLPKWVDKASMANYRMAQKIGSNPAKRWKGDRVADLDPLTGEAIDFLKTNSAGVQNSYDQASDIFSRIANTQVTPREVTMGQLKDTDLDANMNPYIDNVESKSLAALNDSRLQALMGNSDKMRSAGAFGGSRHGIVDAVTNAETAKDAGLLSAQLRSEGFNAATKNALTDIQGKYTSDVANRDSDFNAQMAKLDAMKSGAGGILDSASASQAAGAQTYAGMMQAGSIKQQQAQKELDALMAKLQEPRNNRIENLNLRLSALGMSPYGKTETMEQTSTPASSGTDWAQAGMGILSLLMGLSDDDRKTDKEKVGKLPGTDFELWAYRYKKDPKNYPKVVGLMASDVAKKMPEAVKEVNGTRVVDFQRIMESI
jgi:hypothetical protein